MGGWDILKSYIHCTEKQNQASGAMGTKKKKQVLYTLQVLCLTFCQFSPKKAQPKDEKIITPIPPSKNNGISLSTQRWCLYEGSPTLRGGEHRSKFRCL